jgi:hypothetical protein
MKATRKQFQTLKAQALAKTTDPGLKAEIERMDHLFQVKNKIVLGRYTLAPMTTLERWGVQHVVEAFRAGRKSVEFYPLREAKVVI